MKKWEYKFVRMWIDHDKRFNELGLEGWEFIGRRDFSEYIFKREIIKPSASAERPPKEV